MHEKCKQDIWLHEQKDEDRPKLSDTGTLKHLLDPTWEPMY